MAVNAYENYRNVAAQTASKEKLTLMLYDGALKFTNQALLALEENNMIKLNESVRRTLDIVLELQRTLDHKYEIAENYNKMYEYIREKLIAGNTNQDKEALTEAQKYLREFRDMWREAMKIAKILV